MLKLFKNSEDNLLKELLKDNLDVKKIDRIIDSGIDLNSLDEKGRTILFPLVSKRKVEALRYLLTRSIDFHIEDEYGHTVLDEAISKADGVMIRFLLDNVFEINKLNSNNRTIVQDAALEGNHKVFNVLMTYQPDLDIKDGYGKTVLFDAVKGGNLNILIDVVNNVEDIDVVNQEGQTVLFEALLNKNPQIAKTLIMHGIDVNIKDENGQSALYNAVLFGDDNLEIIKLLIKRKIDLNIHDKENKNILDEILHILEVQKNDKRDVEGKYVFIEDYFKYTKITSLLIENGFEINNFDSDYKTTLFKEVDKKNYENIDFLISCGAGLNVRDIHGKNILFQEVLKGYQNYKMISHLIKKGADINQEDDDGRSVMENLIEITLIHEGFKTSNDPRYKKIIEDENYEELFKRLLSFKPKLNKVRANGKTVLFDVINYNHLDLLKTLLNYGLDPNVQDKEGRTPLHILVENGLLLKKKSEKEQFLERLVFLLKFRVNVDAQDHDGKTVFHKAVIADNLEVVEKLLTKTADLGIKDNHGRTALMHTQWHGNHKIARWLIAAGSDINIADNAGFTLLNYAAIFGHSKLVITLIKAGVLMYNKNVKSVKVAKFFKQKEENLEKLLINNLEDDKMQHSLEEVIENTKKEVNAVLEGK